MGQNEMKARRAMPWRVRSTEGLGVAGSTSKCNTFRQEVGSRRYFCFLFRQEGEADMVYLQLTQGERYVIARMRASHKSLREIGRCLGRSASTVSREVRRNRCVHDEGYRAEKAHSRAMVRRGKSRKNSQYSQQEWEQVRALLRRKWSPKQISGRRRLHGVRTISHETIYRYVRQERRRGGELWRHMRVMSKVGRKRRGSPATRGRLIGKRHISERPPLGAEQTLDRALGRRHGDGA
jgi:IS30 family transposase